MTHPARRQFLSSGLGLAAFVAAPSCSLAGLCAPPRFRISLAQWSFHRALWSGELKHLDFAAKSASMGFEGVEYVNSFFKDKAEDEKYLAEMKKRCADSGIDSVLIMCDGEGALGDADSERRKVAVENHYKWLDAAATLGCHAIRVNAQSSGSWDEQVKRAAEGLHALSVAGAERGVSVIVENHGGLSSNGAWLSQVMLTVGHENCGTLPDFGNFHLGNNKWYDRYKGVAELMPYAKAVSAKSHEFDEDGNEVNTDFSRMMRIVEHSGYTGFVGIEYEGGKHSRRREHFADQGST